MDLNYEILYEATERAKPMPLLLSIIIVLLPALFFMVCLILGLKNKKYIFSAIMAALLLYYGCVQYAFSQMPYVDLYELYMDGQYSVCEGVIENYDDYSSHVHDSFEVNGYSFVVRDPPFNDYGYTVKKAKGGALENGINVRICYIWHMGENVIMKLEWVPLTSGSSGAILLPALLG